MKSKRKRSLNLESQKKNRPKNLKVSREREDEASLGERTPFQINQEITRRKAKELYILYGWSKGRLLELGIPESMLDAWLYQPTSGCLSWKAEKDIFEATVFGQMKEHKTDELKDVQGVIMGLVRQGVLNLGEHEKALSVAQIEKLTNVLGKLDHMLNLAEGKPTSIKAEVELTQSEIEKMLRELNELDPFLDYDSSGKIN